MKVSYRGVHDQVEVPTFGLEFVNGRWVELPDDLALQLVDQVDAWEVRDGAGKRVLPDGYQPPADPAGDPAATTQE